MAQKHRTSKALVTFKIKEISFLNDVILGFFFLSHISVTRYPQSSLKLILVIANAKGQRAKILPIRATVQFVYVIIVTLHYLKLDRFEVHSAFELPRTCSLENNAFSFLKEDMIIAVVIAILSNCKLTRKKFRDINWIRTRSLCVSAAVLTHQLSHENPYIWIRPTC